MRKRDKISYLLQLGVGFPCIAEQRKAFGACSLSDDDDSYAGPRSCGSCGFNARICAEQGNGTRIFAHTADGEFTHRHHHVGWGEAQLNFTLLAQD